MAFDGNGTFLRIFDWTADASGGIKIRADRHDTEMDDYANGLSNTITKDGQTQPVADIPMNGHRITNLGAPTDDLDAVNRAYVENFHDFTLGIDVTGEVRFYDGPVLRGAIYSNMGVDPASMIFKTYDAGESEMNAAYLDQLGFYIEDGSYRIMAGETLRGAWWANRSGAAGVLQLESYTDAGIVDGHADLTARGLTLTKIGAEPEFRAGVRATFGWDDVKGACIRAKDVAEVVVNELMVRAGQIVAQKLGSVTAGVASHVFEDDANFGRAKVTATAVAAATTLDLTTHTDAGVQSAKLTVKAEGLFMSATKGVAPGDTAGDLVYNDQRVFDMGWFPKPAGGTGITNYPVGTDLFFSSNDASIQNRNQAVTMKGAPGSQRIYQLNGAEPALTGTWVSCGAYSPVANVWIGTARRVA